MNRILLVDNEQNALNALRRELMNDYEIETFSSPDKPLLSQAINEDQEHRFLCLYWDTSDYLSNLARQALASRICCCKNGVGRRYMGRLDWLRESIPDCTFPRQRAIQSDHG